MKKMFAILVCILSVFGAVYSLPNAIYLFICVAIFYCSLGYILRPNAPPYKKFEEIYGNIVNRIKKL
ncbi:hypothetical protein DM558_02695 [Entomomonas moraniae]|uniref:Uncharacterized protein n=1 Tax=Entomomonas moraniae TaxID=2213226 RepID=A0A3S9XBI3_9GAMM|nr:hypothetical protein DM558_02695 [Entomomonas moraniae]